MIYVAIFLANASLGWCWAKYFENVAAKQALLAALWDGLLMGLSAVGAVIYVHNYWALIPTVLGSMVGTFYSVKWGKT